MEPSRERRPDTAEVYTLTIELVSGRFYSDWECVAEVTSDTMLIDLHDFIQDTIEFDNDHLFEFYTGRSYRPHGKEGWRSLSYGAPQVHVGNEDPWERFLRKSEARSARFGEFLEPLSDHPERDELIRHEMGWDSGEDAASDEESDWKAEAGPRHDCGASQKSVFKLWSDGRAGLF